MTSTCRIATQMREEEGVIQSLLEARRFYNQSQTRMQAKQPSSLSKDNHHQPHLTASRVLYSVLLSA